MHVCLDIGNVCIGTVAPVPARLRPQTLLLIERLSQVFFPLKIGLWCHRLFGWSRAVQGRHQAPFDRREGGCVVLWGACPRQAHPTGSGLGLLTKLLFP